MSRFLLALALVACSSSNEEKSDPKPVKETPTGEVATLFTGSSVTLPSEVAKAPWGSGKADVLKAIEAESVYIPSKIAPKVSYDLEFDKAGKLVTIKVATASELEPILTKLWGTPYKTAKGVAFWFATESGLRAWLPDYGKGKAVAFSQYEPITKFLGDKGFTLAFAKDKPLFGATIDELHTAWGTALCDYDREGARIKSDLEKNAADVLYQLEPSQMRLRLCPKTQRTIEQYTPTGDVIRIGRDGKALAFSMSIPTGGALPLQAKVLEELDAKFGKAVELKTPKLHVRSYFDPAAKLRAVATVNEQSVQLEVGPYLPVTELIGGDKPGLSVETASMPGGTFDQIAKDDPAHFRKMGTLASLIYPPTDHGTYNTEVKLDIMDKETATYGYTVVVHHTDREAAGDEVMKLLEAKFGPGKKDAKSTDADITYNFAKAGRKVAARRVSQQWQLRVTK